MCFYFRQTKQALEVANRFRIKKFESYPDKALGEYNGFDHPLCETITNINPDSISLLKWGLIPSWSASDEISKNTLNARIETVDKLRSFKDHLSDRCLIISNGFYEWQHITISGKNSKKKYLVTTPDESLFAFAGICSWWKDPFKGGLKGTFSILTTQANEFMSEIHNTKQRMPVILKPEDEQRWLRGENHKEFAYPYSVELIAQLQEPLKIKRGDSLNLLF
ncbi:MAG: SOS response-associated peptidase [Bacteroidales bacterium]|jgi:putative SOS response-associated peptidase YedK|nr:SOS response-associated peptidase [Bacteroidales bacterium]